MPRRRGVARNEGGGGEGSGTRAVRRRCIVLAKISIWYSVGDGSEAGTFFSALTFGIFFSETRSKKKREREREEWREERDVIVVWQMDRRTAGARGGGEADCDSYGAGRIIS